MGRPVPSAWAGLRLLSEQASAGKACAGGSLPIVGQSRSAAGPRGAAMNSTSSPVQKDPFISIQ